MPPFASGAPVDVPVVQQIWEAARLVESDTIAANASELAYGGGVVVAVFKFYILAQIYFHVSDELLIY